MKKAELILASVAGISFVLYFFLIPGGSQLTIISLSSLSFIYLGFNPVIFYDASFGSALRRENVDGISKLKKNGSIAVGFALSMTLIGILFKLLRWPGSEFLSLGVTGISIAIVAGAIKYSSTKSEFYARILKRAIVIGLIGAFFMLAPETSLLEMQYRNYPSYIDAVKKSLRDPGNKILWEDLQNERKKLNLE